MPANSAESQQLEALPASHYGHWKNLLIRESADLGVAANSHFVIICWMVTLCVSCIHPVSKTRGRCMVGSKNVKR